MLCNQSIPIPGHILFYGITSLGSSPVSPSAALARPLAAPWRQNPPCYDYPSITWSLTPSAMATAEAEATKAAAPAAAKAEHRAAREAALARVA